MSNYRGIFHDKVMLQCALIEHTIYALNGRNWSQTQRMRNIESVLEGISQRKCKISVTSIGHIKKMMEYTSKIVVNNNFI